MAKINKDKFDKYLEEYKEDLKKNGWNDDSYKLEAVKQFHDNWNIDAADFKEMLDKSLTNSNLLNSWHVLPKESILKLADADSECVRGMFKALYDESRDFAYRIEEFIISSDENFKRLLPEIDKPFQNENFVTVYLWLFNPDENYIYKFNAVKMVSKVLGLDKQGFVFKKLKRGNTEENIKQLKKYYEFYDILKSEICKDSGLIDVYDNAISDRGKYYSDPEHVTLTLDFAYYIYTQEICTKETDHSKHHYWWLNADPAIWKFSSMNIGDVETYTLLNEAGNKRQIYKNFLDVKEGDLVIGYESSPTQKVVALCKITQEQDGEKIKFTKMEDLKTSIDYSELKSAPELNNMEFFINPNGSLFKLEKEEYDFIIKKTRENNAKVYDEERFLSEVFMTESECDELKEVLKEKKNIILQGAPGVGKTYTARRIAYLIMGEKDDGRIGLVQFHQNYSYEDFIMGYKPCEDGFELKTGIFYDFCEKARNDSVNDYFFIIDEINRGNMSKIFGELLTLIEKDYRGTEVKLGYNGELFSVPENIYIIGMMNTADRSIAFIDYALRRRFSFFEIEPGFDSDGFKKYERKLDNSMFESLIGEIKKLNEDIEKDDSLGKGFKIGHSYFCNWEKGECTKAKMQRVVKYDILPMLDEFWFDEKDKYNKWSDALKKVVEDGSE